MEEAIKHKSELQREFELERVILFSDAVFAIAITLLVLDIKYPPDLPASTDWLQIFKPVLFKLPSFIISFIFIGAYWSRHIELMRLVRQYDKRFIFYNLFFLFFIILFPFSASFLGVKKPSADFPFIMVYMINVVLCGMAFYLLSRYIVKHKPSLCFDGNEGEKSYQLEKNFMWFLMMIVLGGGSLLMTYSENEVVQFSVLIGFVIIFRVVRRRQKKLKAKYLIERG